MGDATRVIGLSLGADLCWPACFEGIVNRLGAVTYEGETHRIEVERVTIEPFDLRQDTRYDVVLDRLTHWYQTSREWIKKAVLMDELYVFNNPWSLQAMEKHSSYVAMMRLGLPVPDTWMVPPKEYEPTSRPGADPAALRPVVRPRPGWQGTRLPHVHETVRRRRLGGGEQDRRRRPVADGVRGVGPPCHAPPARRRALGRVRPGPRGGTADPDHPLRPGCPAPRAVLRSTSGS